VIVERALRAAALFIAVLAVIDPALTRAALDRPVVVVREGAPADHALAMQVSAALAPHFDVSRADVPTAAAYVIAGADLPDDWRPPPDVVVFAVTPAPDVPRLGVLQIEAPSRMSLSSTAPIEAEIQVDGTGDREVTVTLVADDVRVREVTQKVAGQEARVRVPFVFVPSQVGLVRIRIEAAMLGRETVVVDHVLEVTPRVWKVLTFDSRPTYPSTFVRRALETDPRFDVATRVLTSRTSAMQTNPAPSTLSDASALTGFDLVVVGAPDGFGEMEAGALQRYLRERHGAVVLLPESGQGPVLTQLAGQSIWQDDRRQAPVTVKAAHTVSGESWSAAEFLWPTVVPPLAVPLATIERSQPGLDTRPAVWQMPVGSGRLLVSSAMDGWRSRAGAASGFSAFWRAAAASAADATPPAVDITLTGRLLTPGQWSDVTVALFAVGEPVARMIGGADGPRAVRLWPVDVPASGTRREWSGAFRAPDTPGRYQLEVANTSGVTTTTGFVVTDDGGGRAPMRPASRRNGLAELAATSHRGQVVTADQLTSLSSQLSAVVATNPRRESWRPMRSVWWLVPFTLCAAGEWWLRRHRGER